MNENDDFEEVLIGFQRVANANERHFPYALSGALDCWRKRVLVKPKRIDADMRERLLDAASAAHMRAWESLPDSIVPALTLGMRSVAQMAVAWAESEERRAERHPHVYLDLRDCARVLQNHMHNLSLAEMIDERRSKRRAEMVADIKRAAVGNLYAS